MSTTLVVTLIAAWIVVGLLSGLWMARHGHDPLWTLIAVVLGPLFVPIAIERVQRSPGIAKLGSQGAPPLRAEGSTELRVLVGIDGSQESARGLSTTVRLVGPRCGLLVLAEVVHFEAAESADTGTTASSTDIEAAERRLSDLARGVEIAGEVHTDVLAGAPGPALRRFAEQQDMDLLVVGRRGRGLSTRLLGSVSADVIEHSSVPVLVIEPDRAALRRTRRHGADTRSASDSDPGNT